MDERPDAGRSEPGVVLFDLYGVIARDQTPDARKTIERLAGATGDRFWDAYWGCRPPYDAGQPSVDYWAAVARRLGRRFPAGMVAALTEADLDSWSEVDETMVALVAELAAAGRRLGLLSNIIHELADRFEDRHRDWLRHFAAATFSCRIGVAKPDPRAYEIAASRLGVAPPEVLFIDDRDEYVRGARRVGMRAVRFTSPAQVREMLLG